METFAAANRDLNDMGNALVSGANMAPRLTIDTIIALRSVLDRHQPLRRDEYKTMCRHCRVDWPCADAADVLQVMGLPEDDDEGREH
jgi:hypothetical protein